MRRDPRWGRIAAALNGLRLRRRHAVRIVDIGCGDGALLIAALRHARAIGFTAIEGRGTDRAPDAIDRARLAAATVRDPAIGLVFECCDPLAALAAERELPADILLYPVHAVPKPVRDAAARHAFATRRAA